MISGLRPDQFAGLAVLIYLAGTVDAMAGGGGLITLPAYLAFGLNPALVLGTNKLSSAIGTTASCANYQRKHRLDLLRLVPALSAALAGSWLGAHLATRLRPDAIRYMLLAALPVLTVFLLASGSFGTEDLSHRHDRARLHARTAAVSLPIGLYDGFFGPPTGTFFALALVRVCGYDLVGATARAKFLNLASNLSALTAFALAGRLDWKLGLSMGAASLCGHWTGSHIGIRGGARAIRPVVAIVCAALFLKLLLAR